MLVLLAHQERLEVLEILDNLVLLEKLEQQELWVNVDRLDHKECKVSLVHQVFLECLELRETEDCLETRVHKEILDQLEDLENLDLLV